MHQVFIEGGLIRKLWDVETHAYRDHLLQLEAAAIASVAQSPRKQSEAMQLSARPRCGPARFLSLTACCVGPPICEL
jgi:hypothetical protein